MLRPPLRVALFLLFFVSLSAHTSPEPLDPKEFPEVMEIETGEIKCNATVVGPRVLITSRTCLSDKNPYTSIITPEGKLKGFGVQSKFYDPPSGMMHDIGAIIAFGDLTAPPVNVAQVKPSVDDLFYAISRGCPEGTLAGEKVAVTKLFPFTYAAAPAFGCPGYSGAPNFNFKSSPHPRYIFGIGFLAKGATTLTWVRLDTLETFSFFDTLTKTYEVAICGITKTCQ